MAGDSRANSSLFDVLRGTSKLPYKTRVLDCREGAFGDVDADQLVVRPRLDFPGRVRAAS